MIPLKFRFLVCPYLVYYCLMTLPSVLLSYDFTYPILSILSHFISLAHKYACFNTQINYQFPFEVFTAPTGTYFL